MSTLPLNDVLHRISETQPALSPSTSVMVGIGAVVAVGIPLTWQVAQHVDTIAHEGSHALVGSLLGGKVDYVKLRRDSSGLTMVRRGGFFPTFMGYLGPSAFGLAAAKLISVGHSVAVLWVGMVLLALLLLRVRNPFGFVTVILSGSLIYLVARYASVGTESVAAYFIAWLLLLAGLRTALMHKGGEDWKILFAMTKIKRPFWSMLWIAGTAAALVVGGGLLV